MEDAKVFRCAGVLAGAVLAVGGTIVTENTDVGEATVSSSDPAFVQKADRERALFGASNNRPIGQVPRERGKPSWRGVESEKGSFHGNGPRPRSVSGDPLSGLQWDMQLIGATPAGSYRHDRGNHAVRGTSMASPHAVGVAAIIVAEKGQRDSSRGGVTPSPDKVERILRRTGTGSSAPSPRRRSADPPARGTRRRRYGGAGQQRARKPDPHAAARSPRLAA